MAVLQRKVIPSKEFLHQKYLVEGLSSAEIAAQTSSSRPTITAYLKKYGISLKIVTRRSTGRSVYGYRYYGGKAIEVKKEQAVIEKIKALRDGGKSYQEIANRLNTEDVETKSKKSIWHGKVVRQIFQRHTTHYRSDLCKGLQTSLIL